MHDHRLLIETPPRRVFAHTPTPVHPLPRLSNLLGARIYCKRDDLTGFGFGGNKVRKLEYLLSAAAVQDCDCIVTCGSNQSNWCCAVAVAGAVLGLDVYLVLGGPVPEQDTGNLRLDRLAGATLSHVDTSDDSVLESASQELAESLEALGRRPYRIVMGGSTGLGSLGYVEALREVAAFEAANDIRFSAIFHASGSAGTQAGLIAGKTLLQWHGEIVGVATSRSCEAQQQRVRGILAHMLDGDTVRNTNITVEDGYVGAGYRQRTSACAEAIELFARLEGIFVDEVYTGKAAAGLIDYGRKGRLPERDGVLFLHTGGTAQLFE